MLHSGIEPPGWGTWRFLPWHRFYPYIQELTLQASGGGSVLNSDISIPYWDWSNPKDQAIPKWLENIIEPVGNIEVQRYPGAGGQTLPPPEDVDRLMRIDNYLDFTQCLEMGKGVCRWKRAEF